jgi:hypothetical protein
MPSLQADLEKALTARDLLERPYVQALVLLLAYYPEHGLDTNPVFIPKHKDRVASWYGIRPGGSVQPFYFYPIQSFEDSLRKERLVPPSPALLGL